MVLRRGPFVRALAASAILSAAGTPGVRAAAPRARSRVRLGYVGYPCEAATYSASGAPFTARGIDARLVAFDSEDAAIAALGSGRIDAASMNLPALLKPLQDGADIRISAGLHAGCLRVVAPEEVVFRSLGNLRGASVATDRLHGPSMNLLAALLHRQGIDPEREVTWHAYAPDTLEARLDAKQIDCVAASDPVGYYLIADKKATPYLNTADGGFTCGEGVSRGHHCFLALHGRLAAERPHVAAALTQAYIETSAAFGRITGGAALTEVRGRYVDSDLSTTIGLLSSYDWDATTDFTLEEIELTARDFRRAGLLAATTDPERLAETAFADVFAR